MHIIKELVAHGVDVNAVDRWGGTPLADAARHEHKAAAAILREAGARLGMTDGRAATEMCELAFAGNLPALLIRLDCGIDGNVVNFDRRTALHVAAAEGHRHIVDELVKRGATDRALTDRWGHKPVDDAKLGEFAAVVKLLE